MALYVHDMSLYMSLICHFSTDICHYMSSDIDISLYVIDMSLFVHRHMALCEPWHRYVIVIGYVIICALICHGYVIVCPLTYVIMWAVTSICHCMFFRYEAALSVVLHKNRHLARSNRQYPQEMDRMSERHFYR